MLISRQTHEVLPDLVGTLKPSREQFFKIMMVYVCSMLELHVHTVIQIYLKNYALAK